MKKLFLLLSLSIITLSCVERPRTPQQESDSGVRKATVKVPTDEKGTTIEQRNIEERLIRDNKPGDIKHLYVISSYTGDVMEYSTVVGKVTSGGKRLSPSNVLSGQNYFGDENYVFIGSKQYTTNELIDDNGTYGSSANYIYWFDTQGNYHQYFPSGGTYVHISDKPLRIRKVNLSISLN